MRTGDLQACPKETRKGACAVKRVHVHVHVHVSVANGEDATGFYSALFATKAITETSRACP